LVTLQIRDWLTVEEEMLRQQSVVVGDVDEIMHLLDKQKVNQLYQLYQKQHFFVKFAHIFHISLYKYFFIFRVTLDIF